MTGKQKNKIIRRFAAFFETLLKGFSEMPPAERLQTIELCRKHAPTESNKIVKMLYQVCAEKLPELHGKISETEGTENVFQK